MLSHEDIIMLGGTGPRHPGSQGRPLLVRPDLGLTRTSRGGGQRDVVDGHPE
ncbi:hypothetical protein [Arthrobacter sp. ISL-30]|uniref:hypothetical protein n=1 Tax=Arthrobacter sp. ISL-30 TaxID=2819109 RepID=UPI001BE5AC9E|nr:hypothetical protein [Arthrobacter sp. ISL-30]MBT2513101.1 hypothetical protein [Arthrobacter sp. ISL-30]